jgi:CHASE2 domain-containing sensor protein
MAGHNQHEERHEDRGLRDESALRAWRILASLLFGCLLALLMPSRFTEEIGAQAIARLAAPLEGWLYKPIHRDDITVLLIDEKALAAGNGTRWPAPFRFYEELIERIDQPKYRPKAIFFDIVFTHDQGDDATQSFKNEIDKVNLESGKHRPIVFVAAGRDRDRNLTVKALDDFKGATKVGIEYAPNEVDHITWTYRLFFEEPLGFRAVPERREIKPVSTGATPDCPPVAAVARSAALAIYEDAYCREEPQPYGRFAPSMVLTWGLDTAESGLLWKAEDDEEKEAREEAHFISFDPEQDHDDMYCTSDDHDRVLFGRAQARAFARSLSRPLCVFHRTIHASQIPDMTPGEMKAAFDNKVVMIGTSLRYSNDIVVSPLHDRIPGVFLHAMALDNLLQYHGRYQPHWEPPSDPFDPRWLGFAALWLLGMVPIILVHLLKERSRKSFRKRHPRPHEHVIQFEGPWWKDKLYEGAFNAITFLMSGALLIVSATLMLVVGQEEMHVPFLAVSHLVACAVAAEWLDLGTEFVNWFLDVKE